MRTIGIGLLGCGNVGSAFVELCEKRRETTRHRHGIDLQIKRVAVRDQAKARGVPAELLTTKTSDVTQDESVDTVVELMGGSEAALEAARRALNAGKHFVTANKALMAAHGRELFDLAHQNGVELRFEASVGGAVPTIGTLTGALCANDIHEISAILNGTCNFILSRMAHDKMSYDEALDAAKRLGFAEADPTFDVEGRDSAQKLCILSALAFGLDVREDQFHVEGITHITQEDIECADFFDYRLRLIASAKKTDRGIEMRVSPALVPRGTFLATIEDEFNGFLIKGDSMGDAVLIGKGAGPLPTAGAVLADVIDVSTTRSADHQHPSHVWAWNDLKVVPSNDIEGGYYLRFPVANEPGIIGKLTSVLAGHDINIDSAHARQAKGNVKGGLVEVLSQRSSEKSVQTAIAHPDVTNLCDGPVRMLRIAEWQPTGGYFRYER